MRVRGRASRLQLIAAALALTTACHKLPADGHVGLFDSWLVQRGLPCSASNYSMLGGVTRRAIPLRIGEPQLVTLTVPRAAELTAGVGLSEHVGSLTSDPIVVSVSLCDEAEPHVLASVQVAPVPDIERSWAEIRADLSSYAGEEVKLCFEANGGASWNRPNVDASPAEILVAEPIVMTRGFIDTTSRRPNLVLITLDTMRADHLSAAGYPLPTTPNLDRLAEDGDLFLSAVANAPYTLPSHASLFTGLYPREHNARADPQGEFQLVRRFNGLSSDAVTLAEQLESYGYDTAAVVAGPMLSASYGFAQGFRHYDETDSVRTRRPSRHGEEITDRALELLDRTAAPFFLFLNYFDPHWPYEPAADLVDKWVPASVEPISPQRQGVIWSEVLGGHRDITPEEKRSMIAHYDGAIATMDRQIGRLIAGLEERGLYQNTMIVAVSDHGESFGEHRMLDHAHSLYDDVLRAALIIKYANAKPRGEPAKLVNRVDLLDVYATICSQFGISLPQFMAAYGVDRPPRDHIVELERNTFYVDAYGPRFDHDLQAIYRGDMKLIRSSKGEQWLFDLASDPLEENDLSTRDSERAAELGAALDAWSATAATRSLQPLRANVSPELEQRLKALGYVGN